MCAPRSIALTEGPGTSCGSAGTVNGCKRDRASATRLVFPGMWLMSKSNGAKRSRHLTTLGVSDLYIQSMFLWSISTENLCPRSNDSQCRTLATKANVSCSYVLQRRSVAVNALLQNATGTSRPSINWNSIAPAPMSQASDRTLIGFV